MVKNQGTKQREQRTLGDCWQWESNGQCSREDNCSFRHDFDKRAKMTQSNTSPNSFMQQNERKTSRTRSPRRRSPSGRMSPWPCKDYLKGTCTNSFCEKWHPPESLFFKSKSGCRFGKKCSYAHRQVNPACEVHKAYCTSYQNSRPKSLARFTFIQVNLISVAPTLQNLRIGLRRRQSGKSKVPAKQRGSWPKV